MYVREGLGKAWYETALDIASQAGSAVVGSIYGPGAAEAVQSLHKGWTGLVFGNKSLGPAQAAAPKPPTPSAPAPAPRPAPSPVNMRSGVMRSPGRMMTTATPPPAGGGTNWLLFGSIGLGAVVLYMVFRKAHPSPSVPR